jgi:hypothetical protein
MFRLLAAVAAAALPLAAHAHEAGAAGTPAGPTLTAALGGGGELGLEEGKAGVFELEAAVGYEASGVRPELALVLGLAPDSHFALRPGVRVAVPGLPIHVRLALDAATSRGASGLDLRWLLVGVGGELRWTSVLGMFAEVDSGAPLSSRAGLPLLVRAGASFRF